MHHHPSLSWSRRLLRAAALHLLFSACSVPRTLILSEPELPADATWVAILAIGDDDGLLGSTGLVARTSGGASYLFPTTNEPPQTYEVVAFRDEQLNPLHPPQPPELLRGLLTTPRVDGPPLPTPIFARRYSPQEGSLAEVGPAPTRPLTAPWLPDCPQLVGPGRTPTVDASCSAAACYARVQQNGCQLELDLEVCALGRVQARVDGAGSLREVEAPGVGTCEAIASRAPAVTSLACVDPRGQRCSIDLYDQLNPPPLEVHTATVVEVEPIYSEQRRPVSGYLVGMVVLEDQVVVVSRGPMFRKALECEGPAVQAELVYFDQDAMRVLRRVPAPYCVNAAGPDPTQPNGLILAFGEGDHRVARCDALGDCSEQIALGDGLGLEPDHRALAIADAGAGRIALNYQADSPDGTPSAVTARIVSLDARTLSEPLVSPPITRTGNRIGVPMLGAFDGRLATIDVDDEVLRVYDARTLEESGRYELRARCTRGAGSAPSLVLHDPRTGRIVLPNTDGDSPTMITLKDDLSDPCAQANFPIFSGSAWAAAPWVNPSTFLVAVTTRDRVERTALAIYSVEENRFWPGASEEYAGPGSWARTDAQGRVWMIFPTTGKLMRVTPR